MLNTLSLLLAYQLVGEILVRLIGLPIPAPVIGLILLLLTFLVRGRVSQRFKSSTNDLLQHLSLLYIPAGVGVTLHLARVSQEWLSISLALVISSLAGMTVSALILRAFSRTKKESDT